MAHVVCLPRVPGARVTSVKVLCSVDLHVAVGDGEGNLWLFKSRQVVTRITSHRSPITSISWCRDTDIMMVSSYGGSTAWLLDRITQGQTQTAQIQRIHSPAPFTAVVHCR